MSDRDVPPETTAWVEQLHSVVDECARPVEEANAARIVCRAGCANCCVDDLTVFEVEASVIRRHFAGVLANEVPHPRGGCAFLDADERCRIYAHRPYVCRTQGLPLRWVEEAEDDATGEPCLVESRDICPKNVDGGPPLEELEADACWTLGPFESRLAQCQSEADGRRGKRAALRGLFAQQNEEGAPEERAETDRRRLPVIG